MKISNITSGVIYGIITIIFLFLIYVFVTGSGLFYKKNYSVECEYFLSNGEFELWQENNSGIINDLESINSGGVYFDKNTCTGKIGIVIYYGNTGEYKRTLEYIGDNQTLNSIPYKIEKYNKIF